MQGFDAPSPTFCMHYDKKLEVNLTKCRRYNTVMDLPIHWGGGGGGGWGVILLVSSFLVSCDGLASHPGGVVILLQPCPFLAVYMTLDFTMSPLADKGT